MFTVTPPENNDLCRNGGKPKARRRAAFDIDDETRHVVRKRETTKGMITKKLKTPLKNGLKVS